MNTKNIHIPVAKLDSESGRLKYTDADGNEMTFVTAEGKTALKFMDKLITPALRLPASLRDENGNIYEITELQRCCLINKQELKHVFIPEGVKRLDSSLFADSNSLLSIYIPSSVEYIGHMLWRCPSFEENSGGKIYYTGTPEQWTKLVASDDNRWFLDYTDYNAVVRFIDKFPTTVPDMDFDTIYDEEEKHNISYLRCCEKGGEIIIPEFFIDESGEQKPITHVGTCAFAVNNEITKVIIPPTVEKICRDAFYKCSNLEEVIIMKSDSKLIIDDGAFYGCKNLKTLTVGRECKWGSYSLDDTQVKP